VGQLRIPRVGVLFYLTFQFGRGKELRWARKDYGRWTLPSSDAEVLNGTVKKRLRFRLGRAPLEREEGNTKRSPEDSFWNALDVRGPQKPLAESGEKKKMMLAMFDDPVVLVFPPGQRPLEIPRGGYWETTLLSCQPEKSLVPYSRVGEVLE